MRSYDVGIENSHSSTGVNSVGPSYSTQSKHPESAPFMEFSPSSVKTVPKKYGWRTLTAFWILGLCNNYGYVVMLSAAHDILHQLGDDSDSSKDDTLSNATLADGKRVCNKLSTGAILLADILPSLFIKLTAPFFPLVIHIRMALILLLSASGFVLVGVAKTQWVALFGVVCTSLASGLGEVSLLAYMALYKTKNVISTWSSGTGGAGFFGSFTYAGFTSLLGLTPAQTMYVLLSIPVLMGVCFWLLLESPEKDVETGNQSTNDSGDSSTMKLTGLREKLKAIPPCFKYMIPFALVYLFEYFINQGLFELVQFDNWYDVATQYRVYQVLYQIGVFISRSSINLFEIKYLWLMASLQGLNVILFGFQAVYTFIPYIYIVFVLVLWEGLLGGCTYVNTYARINKEVPMEKREFSMAITSLSDAFGISIAGFLSLPAHNYICKLPKY